MDITLYIKKKTARIPSHLIITNINTTGTTRQAKMELILHFSFILSFETFRATDHCFLFTVLMNIGVFLQV